jgi:inhibitor of cysteine peptidase
MTPRIAAWVAFVGLACAVAGCSSSDRSVEPSPNALPRELTPADFGKVVELHRGQTVMVELSANRTTGYTWVAVLGGDPVLVQQGPARYIASQSEDSKVVGAGGTEIFTFVANGVGEQQLDFEYRRPWEKNVEPARKQSYRVAVRR